MNNDTHIVVEARSLAGPGGGVQTYTRELITGIAKQRAVHTLYADSEHGIDMRGITAHELPLRNELLLSYWLQRQVPKILSRITPDIVHFTKADVPHRKQFPTIVTIYDIIPLLLPETQSFFRRMYWPTALQRAATYADHIVTISNASKEGIVERLQVDPEKVTVTSLGINHGHFIPASDTNIARVRAKYELPNEYILFVGTRDVRKNIAALIAAYNEISKNTAHDLVIAGRAGDKQDTTEEMIQRSGIADRIHVLGKVSYEDLPILYSGAQLFVWPSVYEGWGFPPLEAMACGVPVITSDGGSLPEAVGDAGSIVSYTTDDLNARLSDQIFVQNLASQILDVLTNTSLQASMRMRGLEHVKMFSWDSLVEQTLAVYDQVLAQ